MDHRGLDVEVFAEHAEIVVELLPVRGGGSVLVQGKEHFAGHDDELVAPPALGGMAPAIQVCRQDDLADVVPAIRADGLFSGCQRSISRLSE